MAARRPANWVSAIERVARQVGVLFFPTRETIWFDPAAFVVTDSEANNRTEVRGAAPSGLLPFVAPVLQVAFSSSAHPDTVVAFASTEAPSYITGVTFVSGGAYAASDANYVGCTLYDAPTNGAGSPTPLGTATGTITGTYATGNWIDGKEAFTIGLAYELPAGHRLAAVWTQHGGVGAACPGGSFRVT